MNFAFLANASLACNKFDHAINSVLLIKPMTLLRNPLLLLCGIYDINKFMDFDVKQHDLQSAVRQWL